MLYELPLFPLNEVLFPGTPLHLHIFEERYKRMIRFCLETHQPFGVVLIRHGLEALGPLAEPFRVGCTAQITEVQRLDEGRMNLIAIGVERFRIVSLNYEAQPYLIGTVEPFPLVITHPLSLRKKGARLRAQVERYLKILIEAGQAQFDFDQLPLDPVEVAYLAAGLLQMEPREKQALLAFEMAVDLLSSLQAIYRKETALVKAMVSKRVQEQGIFSSN